MKQRDWHCAWLEVKEHSKNMIFFTASQLNIFTKQPKQSGFLKRTSDIAWYLHSTVECFLGFLQGKPYFCILLHTSALFCLLRYYFKIAWCSVCALCFSSDMSEHMVAWVKLAEGNIQFVWCHLILAWRKRDEIFSLWNTNKNTKFIVLQFVTLLHIISFPHSISIWLNFYIFKRLLCI